LSRTVRSRSQPHFDFDWQGAATTCRGNRGFMLLASFGVVFLSSLIALAVPPEKDYTAGCLTSGCHEGLAKQPVVHPPTEQGGCDACHEAKPETKHSFTLKEKGAALCTECHEAEKFEGKVVHAPITQGQCTACHDPHSSKEKALIRFESTGAMCGECHSETLEGLKFVHGPAAAGQCTTCHSPHASSEAKLLRTTDPGICLECHSDIGERVAELKHKHPPVESACLSCHKPHGAGNKMMLTATAPTLCNDCHEEVATKVADSKCKHSPAAAEGGCTACHDAHASMSDGLLKQENSAKTCLSCHDKAIKTGERALLNIGAHLKSNPNPHGPIRDGSCMPCHDPHGADRSALLAKNFPAKLYSAYSADAYGLCFDCHEAEAFESAQGGDTQFRNGNRNLHYLHVNKSFKGRNCRACHDPHASTNDKHIREQTPFGTWSIPIRFVPTETGGSCGPGCHQTYRYDRKTPVSNINGAN
jgi:predicted CXXCH cytochrome family protein